MLVGAKGSSTQCGTASWAPELCMLLIKSQELSM